MLEGSGDFQCPVWRVWETPLFCRHDFSTNRLLIPHLTLSVPPYPFTPVNEMPSINNRCAKKKSTTIGSIVTSEAAIK